MIGNLSEEEFANTLHQYLSPSRAIQSEEHLYGRDTQLQRIKEALYSPGRTVFIYGDRGAGKTSLAQTVAFSHQNAKYDPVIKACGAQTTFGSLIRHIADTLSGKQSTSDTSVKVGYKLPKGLGAAEVE